MFFVAHNRGSRVTLDTRCLMRYALDKIRTFFEENPEEEI